MRSRNNSTLTKIWICVILIKIARCANAIVVTRSLKEDIMNLTITQKEREYLRELAKKQAEIAALPIMKQRTEEWYAHNALKGKRPMIVIETNTFWQDMKPESKCESPFAKWLEDKMLRNIVQHEQIDDDIVCPDYIDIPMSLYSYDFGIDIERHNSADTEGRQIGYELENPITCIEDDFHILKPFEFFYHPEDAKSKADAARDILGDILDVRIVNEANRWYLCHTSKAVTLMGLENWMISIMDEPEEHHRLMRYLADNTMAFFKWQEDNGLLTMNNGNDYVGAGSYGFSHDLAPDSDGKVRLKDLWVNMNSQESYSISPAQYKEFVFPYYKEFTDKFGYIYYGCCEPVHPIWKDCLETIPNLRKVSISAWCDEDFMGEALRGSNTIYSRKPAPRYLGVGHDFDEAGYTEHVKKTLHAARGCNLEFIFRDVYTLTGDTTKPRRAVKIIRDLIETEWK